MTNPSQAIEVEVVEIDGAAPLMKGENLHTPAAQRQWQQWQGRLRKLDSRWWPLWVLLGGIAVVLLLTVGVAVGLVFVISRVLSRIARALLR